MKRMLDILGTSLGTGRLQQFCDRAVKESGERGAWGVQTTARKNLGQEKKERQPQKKKKITADNGARKWERN